MNHVQAVTVLEAMHPDNNNIRNASDKSSVTIKRNAFKDTNNNTHQITKESLNATVKPVDKLDEPEEYLLFGLIKFKSPIKWLNTVSIVLIHLIFIYGFLTYPMKAKILTTFWGKIIFWI